MAIAWRKGLFRAYIVWAAVMLTVCAYQYHQESAPWLDKARTHSNEASYWSRQTNTTVSVPAPGAKSFFEDAQYEQSATVKERAEYLQKAEMCKDKAGRYRRKAHDVALDTAICWVLLACLPWPIHFTVAWILRGFRSAGTTV